MPARVAEGDLVEDLAPGAAERELDAAAREILQVLGNPGPHESQRGGVEVPLVQAEEQPAVGQHAVGMGPGVGGRRLDEAQALVELHGIADIRGLQADFVKSSQHEALSGCASRRPCRPPSQLLVRPTLAMLGDEFG